MTRLLNRMMDKGWVVRERGTEDRREVLTTLTTAGKLLLKKIDAPLASLHAQQCEAISDFHNRCNPGAELLAPLKLRLLAPNSSDASAIFPLRLPYPRVFGLESSSELP